MSEINQEDIKTTGRDRPFSPPPESSVTNWLIKILIVVALVYLGFKLVNWQENSRQPSKAVETVYPNAEQPPSKATSSSPAQSRPVEANVITKCVVQGKVSYGDDGCPQGAITSKVATNTNQNLMAAVKVPVAIQATNQEQPLPMTAQVNPGEAYASLKAECAELEARIKHLDSVARQPQSGQTQDWILEERKKARDRQVRVPCT
jgi:hypothetical protein